jgi:hypothetical protein
MVSLDELPLFADHLTIYDLDFLFFIFSFLKEECKLVSTQAFELLPPVEFSSLLRFRGVDTVIGVCVQISRSCVPYITTVSE